MPDLTARARAVVERGYNVGLIEAVEEALSSVREEALREAAEVAESYEPRCDTCPRGVAAAILALRGK